MYIVIYFLTSSSRMFGTVEPEPSKSLTPIDQVFWTLFSRYTMRDSSTAHIYSDLDKIVFCNNTPARLTTLTRKLTGDPDLSDVNLMALVLFLRRSILSFGITAIALFGEICVCVLHCNNTLSCHTGCETQLNPLIMGGILECDVWQIERCDIDGGARC